jgi:hypothetical protein
LKVLISDADRNTRVNAAVALARQKSTAGFRVFKDVLQSPAMEPNGSPTQLESLLAVKNSLHAVKILARDFTAEQRTELEALIDPIANHHAEPRIRTDAIDALVSLRADGAKGAAR